MSILKIILIGLLVLAPEKDGWVRINGDNYISFFFPSRGERLKKEVNGMRSWIFQTKNITSVFGAVCTQLTKEKGVLDAYTVNQLYISMKKESVALPSANLVSETVIPSKNMEIWEICYTVMKDEHEMTYFKRFIFRDNCMYQLTIGGKTEDLEEIKPQKEKFFNSVRFNEETRK